MATLDFATQDIFGVFLAVLLFPSVILFPGYVISWTIDLFDFRRRQFITRHGIALLVSMAATPILFYWLAYFVTVHAVKLIVVFFFCLYLLIVAADIQVSKKNWYSDSNGPYLKIVLMVAIGWVLFSILSLVDLQWGTKLYNNVVSLDFATRSTLVNAISRTGVPPVNPSYFPAQPVYITSLYYFWYILCSIIEQLGGRIVDARMTLIAGDIWCGLALMGLIAFYIKIRNDMTGESAWKMAFIGIMLLTISGLDFIPASIIMLATRLSFGSMWPHGDIEHWNDQITAWVGSLFWAPHHVAAMIACITAFVIFQYYRNAPLSRKIFPMIVAGLAFASAVGLSTWVTIVFSVFLGAWVVYLLGWQKDWKMFWLLSLTGLAALLFASPFLYEILRGGTGGSGVPFAFEVRRFRPAIPFVGTFSATLQNIFYLLLLPLNYLMELGFFFLIGIVWLRHYRKEKLQSTAFFIPEIMLLCVVVAVCSFIRSTVVGTNDFGWRGWLFGQFILLVWATDLNSSFLFLPDIHHFIKTNLTPGKTDIRKLMTHLLLIGIMTTLIDVALLRFWSVLVDTNVAGFPNSLSPDVQLGKRTFDARLAYEFINDNLSEGIIIQQNPLSDIDRIDRPSGLYANRQFAISYNAPFNVPLPILKTRSSQISEIFNLQNQNSWEMIDPLCQQYFIDVLVVGDQDSLWDSVTVLQQQRSALYQNRYYAIFPCGKNDYLKESIP